MPRARRPRSASTRTSAVLALLGRRGIWSDGDAPSTSASNGDDNETDDGRLHYFGPRLEANLNYERFQHQLDAGFLCRAGRPFATAGNSQHGRQLQSSSATTTWPGQDYAIRVQEFKANFKGNFTDNLKWRVNVFGIDKEGERQAECVSRTATTPPPATDRPGTLPVPVRRYRQTDYHGRRPARRTRSATRPARAQHIDWQTTEVDAGPGTPPRIAIRTLEYSHTASAPSRRTTSRSSISTEPRRPPPRQPDRANLGLTPALLAAARLSATAGYAIVPDNQTQIDRLKFSTKIGCNTDVYLLGYAGYNEDLLRDTYRGLQRRRSADYQQVDRYLDVDGSGKYYREDSTSPLQALNPHVWRRNPAVAAVATSTRNPT